MSFKNIYVILVKPQLGENIGATARALKNFNLTKLRIVNPRSEWPNQKAIATSVGAKNILKSAKIYNSLDKSVGDLDLIFATSSRIRKVNKKIISIFDIDKKLKNKQKIGIIFGPEASGLSNDEISCADYVVKIPTNKQFNSINLSHSVILFCYQIFKFFSKKNFIYKSNYKSSKASKSEVSKLLNFIIKSLDKKGFLQPTHKRNSMINNIKNIFYRLNLSEQEIHILLGIFASLSELNNKR
ncbi:MAG TPA: RNA methyltransferase [Pelagibacteraceae bacterium]|jgi:tRNA/rRNA methyltransferase|nr:RNA methyltransferase [Pelagibacteraceae bacterium]|tara:strand:+ start:1593 stop:2318 length:726 start_codon:yes stop_codon:yes gene_type:complete